MKSPHKKLAWPIVAVGSPILAGGLVLLSIFSGKTANGDSPVEKVVRWASGGKPAAATLVSRRVEHVDADNFEKEVLGSPVPVLVDFYADWCRPCKALSPVLDELARETPHARVVKINVDDNPELARRYRIESIPHLLVFDDSRVVHRRAGGADKASLRRLLEKKTAAMGKEGA